MDSGNAHGCQPWTVPGIFYSVDDAEPVHVHVERENKVAKFWLDPVRLVRSGGFSRKELGRIEKLLMLHEAHLIEARNEYFGS